MRGNPYYEPDYEKYYYDPPWYDRLQDPETYHWPIQVTRRGARRIGPLLPAVAVAVPAGLVIGSIYERGKAKEAERKALIEREERAAKKAQQESNRFSAIMEELKKVGVRATPAIKDTEEVIIDSDESPEPRGRAREPIKPFIPSFNVELPDSIPKVTVHGGDKMNEAAQEIVNQIDKLGYDAVVKSLDKGSRYRAILEDISGALLGPDYFPKPFYKFLNEETRERYKNVRKPKDKAEEELRRQMKSYKKPQAPLDLQQGIKKKDIVKSRSVIQNISSKSRKTRSTPRMSRSSKSPVTSALVSMTPIVRTPEGMRMARIQTLMSMGMNVEDATKYASAKTSDVVKMINK